MLGQSQYTPDVYLSYELLDVTIDELDTKRYIKIIFLDAEHKEIMPYDLLVPRTAIVSDLKKELIEQARLVESRPIRLYEVVNFKIMRTFHDNLQVQDINEFSTIYGEVYF